MIIISHHAKNVVGFPTGAVVRINMAWLKTSEELYNVIEDIDRDVFLDLPEGRNKPPLPVLNIDDAIGAINKYKRIKYLGVSDVRSREQINSLRDIIPKRVRIIPKIESREGVENFFLIHGAMRLDENVIMLDKEDLYTDVGCDPVVYEECLVDIKQKARKAKVFVLELCGVIFADENGVDIVENSDIPV